ncbi:MAG TPA: HEAT repeat domain-containing protein [Candidatus Sumerlaeota bacterium]|nr:HEAT repeat domain-containing protein [Candidatus Sumerlaeota bacterium]
MKRRNIIALISLAAVTLVILILLIPRSPSSLETVQDDSVPEMPVSVNPAVQESAPPLSSVIDRQPSGVSLASLPTRQDAPAESEVMKMLRERVLSGRYGTVPIEELVDALGKSMGGPDLPEILRALAVRKQEALPLVKEKLHTGDWWEKHMMTKLLRYCPWSETFDDLIMLAQSTEDHFLGRQGALFALGAMGDQKAGPQIAELLRDPNLHPDIHLTALTILAILRYSNGLEEIRPYTNSADLQIRIFANRALNELGQPCDKAFLLSCLESEDYVLRVEACAALADINGDDITDLLNSLAEKDFYQAVRNTAKQALIQRQMKGLSESEKMSILKSSLNDADYDSSVWVMLAMLEECGNSGRIYLENVAQQEGPLAERAMTFLLWRFAQ